MKQEFKIIQSSVSKLLLVWLGGIVVLMFVAVKGGHLLFDNAAGVLPMAWCFLVAFSGLYLLYRVGKSVSALPALVTVAANGLTVRKLKSGEEKQVLFEQIATYKASSFNGAEELRVTLRSGGKLKINTSSRLYDDQEFNEMVQAFEVGIEAYQRQAGPLNAVIRERTFFEKPISTIVLVGILVAILVLLAMVIFEHKPVKWGSLLLMLSSTLAYVAAWLAASGKRRQ